jgi:hypothetical protein
MHSRYLGSGIRALMLAAGLVAAAPAAADTLLPFTAVLNGAQETPPVASPSQGVAFLTLNKDTSQVCYAISFSPLGGTEILAHFHGPGAPGVAAGILHNISPAPSPFGSPKNGCITFSKADIKNLNKGLIYINIHSSIATAGEIRGQVLPTKGVRYPKVPPIGSASPAFLD